MVGLTRSVPHVKAALSAARRHDIGRVDEALRRFGVTGVHGEPEVGVTSVVEATLRASQQRSVRIDLDGVTDEHDVAWLLARGMARADVGPMEFSLMHVPEGLRPTSARRLYVAFAEKAGADIATLALADAATAGSGIEEALRAFERVFDQQPMPPVLWIDHVQAPALTPRHPLDVDRLLWNVRAMQQRFEVPVIVSGNQAATPVAFGPAGAFHGDGAWVTLGRPGRDVWRDVAASLGDQAPPRHWVEEMADIAHAHPATMVLALSLHVELPDRARTALDLWQLMLSLDDGLVARTMQHARSLHRLGGRIVTQVAEGRGPYTDARGPNAVKEIHRAVRRLHEAGMITQPRPRAWELTNPLVAGRLRRTMPQDTDEAVGEEAYDWTASERP